MKLNLDGKLKWALVGVAALAVFGASLALSIVFAPEEADTSGKNPDTLVKEQLEFDDPVIARLEKLSLPEDQLQALIEEYRKKLDDLHQREASLHAMQERVRLAREGLEKQTQALQEEAATLDAAAKRLANERRQLEQTRIGITRDEVESARKNSAVMAAMKPSAAAATLERLCKGQGLKDAALMLNFMDDKDAGRILAYMDESIVANLVVIRKKLREDVPAP